MLFGDADRGVLAVMQLLVLYSLWLVGEQAALGGWYRLGLAAGAVFFAYQQWLIRRRDPAGCFRAFANNVWFGLAVFVGIALDYLFRTPA